MVLVNALSDLSFSLDIRDAAGAPVGVPAFDFNAVFFTAHPDKGFAVSKKGAQFVNCFVVNGGIRVVAEGHNLEPGILQCRLSARIPSQIHPDGFADVTNVTRLPVRLTAQPVAVAAFNVEVALPVVFGVNASKALPVPYTQKPGIEYERWLDSLVFVPGVMPLHPRPGLVYRNVGYLRVKQSLFHTIRDADGDPTYYLDLLDKKKYLPSVTSMLNFVTETRITYWHDISPAEKEKLGGADCIRYEEGAGGRHPRIKLDSDAPFVTFVPNHGYVFLYYVRNWRRPELIPNVPPAGTMRSDDELTLASLINKIIRANIKGDSSQHKSPYPYPVLNEFGIPSETYLFSRHIKIQFRKSKLTDSPVYHLTDNIVPGAKVLRDLGGGGHKVFKRWTGIKGFLRPYRSKRYGDSVKGVYIRNRGVVRFKIKRGKKESPWVMLSFREWSLKYLK